MDFKIPGKKITINMAPADLGKEGAAYDLSIAIGILAASNHILTENINEYIIMGNFLWTELYSRLKAYCRLPFWLRKKVSKGIILPKQINDSLSTFLK